MNLQLDEPCMQSINEMHRMIANDPVGAWKEGSRRRNACAGLAVAFDLAMRLFCIHVLGVRADVVGLPRRGGRRWAAKGFADGFAFASQRPGIFGPVAAIFGPIEGQARSGQQRGRGCAGERGGGVGCARSWVGVG